MFLGTHTPHLDDKGRLILPAKFRDELAGGVVITKGQERCLYVFTTAEFGRIAGQLHEQPVTHKAARAYSRVFFASAHDEVPDRQGRVTIPAHLRDYAGLGRELTGSPGRHTSRRVKTRSPTSRRGCCRADCDGPVRDLGTCAVRPDLHPRFRS
jgi:MraZ protein